MTVLIRDATSEDAADIARVHVESWRTTYRGILPDDVLQSLSIEKRLARWRDVFSGSLDPRPTGVLVAEGGGRVVGFASAGPERTGNTDYDGEVYAVYLLAEYQRRGIGRQLISAAAARLLEAGFRSCLVRCLTANPAQRFYRALGGREVRRRTIHIGDRPYEEAAYGWQELRLLAGRDGRATPFGPASKPSKIKAVVFDLDGLMFNTEEVFNRTGRQLLARRGHRMTDELLSRMMGRRAPEAFAAMIEMCGMIETVEELKAESEQIFYSLLDDHLAPMPGLLDLLEAIESRGLPKGVATSSTRDFLKLLLGRFELTDRFQLTLAAEDVRQGKPHPEIYLTAAAELGVDPAEMLVLEDSQTGTRAASEAGAVVVAVPHEFSRAHDFSPARRVAAGLDDPLIVQLLDA